ncbi:MAG TPA: choline-sulfatase, partial [Paracoccaceae bacterium]|nr:choline-sulfatase [Paracoccaceae bacterium]
PPCQAKATSRIPASTLDVVPTLAALADISLDEVMPWTAGTNLIPVANGAARDAVPMEYAAEGSITPLVCLRDGPWKYQACAADPELLFNLDSDPRERANLATDPAHAATLAHFRALASARWDLARFDADVRQSQARRWVVYEALRNGAYFPWDYQPLRAASERYMRNHMDLNVLEENKRFPRGE